MTTEEILDVLPSLSVADLYVVSSACLTQLKAVSGHEDELPGVNRMTRQRFCRVIASLTVKEKTLPLEKVDEIIGIINMLTAGGLDVLIRNVHDTQQVGSGNRLN